MRIGEDKEFSGAFWLACCSEIRVPGTLTVKDGGAIELEVVGAFDGKPFTSSDDSELGRILGEVAPKIALHLRAVDTLTELSEYLLTRNLSGRISVVIPGGERPSKNLSYV